MTTTICDDCGTDIRDHEHSLFVRLDGFGDRGMLDTAFDGPVEVELCERCARSVLETHWGARALPALNMNAGHVCADGLVWVAMADCSADPDRHGWRPVFAVVPDVPGRCPDRAPLVGPRGGSARYETHVTEAEADDAARALRACGVPCRVVRTLVGNESHGEIVDPAEWLAWWPHYNRRWLQEERRIRRRAAAAQLLRHPARTGRWLLVQHRRRRSVH